MATQIMKHQTNDLDDIIREPRKFCIWKFYICILHFN